MDPDRGRVGNDPGDQDGPAVLETPGAVEIAAHRRAAENPAAGGTDSRSARPPKRKPRGVLPGYRRFSCVTSHLCMTSLRPSLARRAGGSTRALRGPRMIRVRRPKLSPERGPLYSV